MAHKKEIRHYKNKNGYYYISIRGMKFKTSKKKTLKEALEVGKQELGLVKHGPVATVTLGEWAEKFFTPECPRCLRLADSDAPLTQNYIKAMRSKIKRYLFTDVIQTMKMGEIKRGNVLDYVARIKLKTGSSHIADHMIKLLSVLFEEARYREDFDRNPASKVRRDSKRVRPIPELPSSLITDFFPKDSLGPWKSKDERVCFLIAATTGMRRGEIIALRWSNVIKYKNKEGEDRAYIYVCEALNNNRLDAELGPTKNKTPRFCSLPMFVWDELQELPVNSKLMAKDRKDFVLMHPSGTHNNFHFWQEGFTNAKKKFGIKYATLVPHHFRHFINSQLHGYSDVSNHHLRANFGWGSDDIMKNYTHEQLEHLEVIGNAIDNLYASATG